MGVNDVRHIEVHTAQALVPEHSIFEVGIAIEKLEQCKSPGIYQILAELVHAADETLYSEVRKLGNSILNKEELPPHWKESIIIPICKKCNKTECNNFRGILLFPASYKILSNILLSKLTPYVDEIIGNHHC
jgi:hypothetical protein